MEFDFSAAQRDRRDRVRTAVAEQFGAREATTDPESVRLAWKAAAGIGLTGLCLPADQGGEGLGALDTALSLEAFGRSCPDTGFVFAVAAHLLSCAVPVWEFGSREVRATLPAGMAAGELIAGNAMTEDDAGSDVGRIRTAAVRSGEGYLLTGEKSFVSNAPIADVFVTYAVTNPSAGFLGVSAFAVPRDLDGISVGPPHAKMGLHGCPAARVRFDGCAVPERFRLGTEGGGGAVFQYSMAWERSCLFAAYLGLMERQLEECVRHVTRRRQFGRRLSGFQAVSHRIARMRQRLEAARLLLYRACWLLDQGRDDVGAIAMSKTAVSEAAVANGLDAVQLFGAAGYLADGGIEQQLRDCVPTTIFSGTTEIQLDLIAREAGL
ncbi:acyl-CoA dehydrogenase family protein [Actinomadura mexicana]|uniref:Clorobiocin biosynthesis protein CloN3 n=1 Tax=Actinomadura mexicana TaxID=134959 RepID=A0A238XN09_9ACTN|nr:acyl-CoA dehydrogenase family protein [Actinomadura mexicana]SNR59744.1 clorobiocin biosynthesis protein CloN3 [Actinomadura mexicana]